MAEGNIVERLGKGWAASAALVTAILYVCGFIVVRIHYQVLGVDAAADPIDKRYLAEGAKLLAAALIVAAVLAVIGGIGSALAPDKRRGPPGEPKGWRRRLTALGLAMFLAAIVLLSIVLLSVGDVLRQEETASLYPTIDPVCILADRGPSPLALPALLALALIFGLALAGRLGWNRWRTSGRIGGEVVKLTLIGLLCALGFALLSGVFFNKRSFEQLARAPTGVETAGPVFLLATSGDKRTVFTRAGGKAMIQQADGKDVDKIARVGSGVPISDLMAVGGCPGT